MSVVSRHRQRQLRLFRSQFLSAAGGCKDCCDAHGLRRRLCLVRLARQYFRDAISPGEKPEGRPATAEELCGIDKRLNFFRTGVFLDLLRGSNALRYRSEEHTSELQSLKH